MTEQSEQSDSAQSTGDVVWTKLRSACRWAADVFKGHAGADQLRKQR